MRMAAYAISDMPAVQNPDRVCDTAANDSYGICGFCMHQHHTIGVLTAKTIHTRIESLAEGASLLCDIMVLDFPWDSAAVLTDIRSNLPE